MKTDPHCCWGLILGLLLWPSVGMQADNAPVSIVGFTFTAIDNGDTTTKTLVVSTNRFTELNNGVFKRSGPYSYTKLAATQGQGFFLRDDPTGDSDTVLFNFATPTNGTYTTLRVRQGILPETRAGSFAASPPEPQPDSFLIATNGVSMSFAFDGTNYLVGIESLGSPSTIGAQLFSASGARIGPPISTGRTGIAAAVAFDGTNYLMIWEDDGLGKLRDGNLGSQIFGQFISKSGVAIGAPFDVSGPGVWFDGIKAMAFGGGRFLVTYTRLIVPADGDQAGNRYIAGRMVSPDGTMGREFRISTGFGDAADVAFDGVNFFVVWCEDVADAEIRGRFVSPAGVPGREISINASQAPSDNPKSVAFDGTNYLVVWNDEVGGTGMWDSFGQLVSPSGVLVGGGITITSEPGPQMVTGVAFDGENYLAIWSDMQNGTNWDVYGQFVGRSGSRVGNKIALGTQSGNQIGGIGFANGKYLVLLDNGVVFGADGNISSADSATGLFIPPAAKLRIQTDDASFGMKSNLFGFTISGVSAQVVVVEIATNLVNPAWYPAATNTLTNGSTHFVDPRLATDLHRLYRLRSP